MSKQTEVCTDPKVGQRFIDLDHNGKAICTLTYICTHPMSLPTGAGMAVSYYLVFDQEPNLSISGEIEMSRDEFIARQIKGRIIPSKDETPIAEKLKNSDSHIKLTPSVGEVWTTHKGTEAEAEVLVTAVQMEDSGLQGNVRSVGLDEHKEYSLELLTSWQENSRIGTHVFLRDNSVLYLEPKAGQVWSIETVAHGYIEVVITKVTDSDSENALVLYEAVESKESGSQALYLWLNYAARGLHKFLRLIESGGVRSDEEPKTPKYSHYLKDPTGYGAIDVYRLLRMFEVTDHEIGHAVKKLLVSGKRGAKGKRQDLIEAIDTLNRLLTIMDEDEALAGGYHVK